MPDLVISSRRVVTPAGIGPATVVVVDGKIEAVTAYDEADAGIRGRLDFGDAVVLPGLVDTHVHINEPGRTEWEGFHSATAAAAAGGVTTLVDMPLNSSPVTTTIEALAAKAAAAEGACSVDYGFWGGVVPGNAGELEGLHDAGVLGFKTFLVPSGIDDFPRTAKEDLERAMPILAERGVPLLVHAELPGPIEAATAGLASGSDSIYRRYLDTRPRSAEVAAVELVTHLAGIYGGPVHIVHVSTAEVGPVLEEARARGVAVTAETCPHYLTFDAESIPEGATEYKCAPPIRDAVNRQLLWHLVESGTLDLIVTDHSPCPPVLKCLGSGDFMAAWGGIASLELSLSAVWTEAAGRGNDLSDVVRWMCEGPARLAGLHHTKGRIASGYDADLVVFDPDAESLVVPESLYQRHAVTPYAGRTLRGRVLRTFLRGREIYIDGLVSEARPGRRLKREGS